MGILNHTSVRARSTAQLGRRNSWLGYQADWVRWLGGGITVSTIVEGKKKIPHPAHPPNESKITLSGHSRAFLAIQADISDMQLST